MTHSCEDGSTLILEEISEDQSNSEGSRSNWSDWMVGLGVVVVMGAVIGLASTARRQNPLPEKKTADRSRLPSGFDLVTIPGVDFPMADRIIETLSEDIPDDQKLKLVSEMFHSHPIELRLTTIQGGKKTVGELVAKAINPGDVKRPTLALVVSEFYAPQEGGRGGWKKYSAGKWYVTTWATMERGSASPPQSRALNPVDTNSMRQKVDEFFKDIVDHGTPDETKILMVRDFFDKFSGLEKFKNEPEWWNSSGANIRDEFLKKVASDPGIPIPALSLVAEEYPDEVFNNPRVRFEFFAEPESEEMSSLMANVAKSTNSREIIAEIYAAYNAASPESRSVSYARLVLGNIAQNKAAGRDLLTELKESQQLWIASSAEMTLREMRDQMSW